MLSLAYGADPSQVVDLHLPAEVGAALPVVVVIHGGFWRAARGRDLGTPLAVDLAGHGVAAWNIEYRRVGNGGGWPGTLDDVARAVDALADLGQDASGGRLDLDRVVTLGHSAGGHLAVWAAARHRLPQEAPGAGPRIRPTGAVSQAGVVDLARAYDQGLGAGAVRDFLGGGPDELPERYALASPYALVPLGVPVALLHGDADDVVPPDQSERYAAGARAAGDEVTTTYLPGVDHMALVDPAAPAWAACRRAVLALLEGR